MYRLLLPLALAMAAPAQIIPGLTLPPTGGNQKASVRQNITVATPDTLYAAPLANALSFYQNERDGADYQRNPIVTGMIFVFSPTVVVPSPFGSVVTAGERTSR